MKKSIILLIALIKIVFLKLQYGKKIVFLTYKQGFKISTKFKIYKNGKMIVGKLVTRNNVYLTVKSGKLKIGNNVYFNRNCIIDCLDDIEIGENCLFGPNVCVYDHDHEFSSNGIERFKFKSKKVVIEPDCWIGAGAIILKGSHVCKGSIIGAGTIVKGYIPPNSLVYSKRDNIVNKIV